MMPVNFDNPVAYELNTECPKCKAKVGKYCVDRFEDGGSVHHLYSHDERWHAYTGVDPAACHLYSQDESGSVPNGLSKIIQDLMFDMRGQTWDE